jgi:hypothetical protein
MFFALKGRTQFKQPRVKRGFRERNPGSWNAKPTSPERAAQFDGKRDACKVPNWAALSGL